MPARRTPWLPLAAPEPALALPAKKGNKKDAKPWPGRAPVQTQSADGLQKITIRNARGHNLKNVTAEIPVGLFTCVTGVSGSGKSTLVNDTLYCAVAKHFQEAALQLGPRIGHQVGIRAVLCGTFSGCHDTKGRRSSGTSI